jgi:hypothetical protein
MVIFHKGNDWITTGITFSARITGITGITTYLASSLARAIVEASRRSSFKENLSDFLVGKRGNLSFHGENHCPYYLETTK